MLDIKGNNGSLLSCSGSVKWDFHFHEVIVLLTSIYVYTICLPLVLWGLMVWRKVDGRYSLFQLLTVYGYSMSAFIPLTVSGDTFI